MTAIEKLLGMSTDELEKATDAEIENYLSPCFIFTRPEKVSAAKATATPAKKLSRKEAEKILLNSMMNILSASTSENK